MVQVPFSRPLAVLLLVLAAGCAQTEKHERGTPPLTDGETSAPPAATEGEPIPADQVDPERAAAYEQCYSYAQSQVRADQQIDQDISGRYGRTGIGGDYGNFRQQLKPYEYERRRDSLFRQCMQRRGFAVE